MNHYALNIMLAPKDNLETMLIYYTKCQSQKRELIQSNIYIILLIVNQVIYTLDTICEPNIMTLAQAILLIFCSQGPLWVKCLNPKREIIQSNKLKQFFSYFVHKVLYGLNA